jgi:Zn-dependent protease
MSDTAFLIFDVLVLVFSVMIHEVSHGYIAERLGDSTARHAGRLTLNPLRHIDPVGSVLLPAVLHFSGAPMFGWAKPVPYNPANLRDPVGGGAKIAAAGPLSNFLLAAVFGLLIRALFGTASPQLLVLFAHISLVNIWLGVFNLFPIPPLDGSKVLYAVLPRSQGSFEFVRFLEQYGFLILIGLIFFMDLGPVLSPVVRFLFTLFAGDVL